MLCVNLREIGRPGPSAADARLVILKHPRTYHFQLFAKSCHTEVHIRPFPYLEKASMGQYGTRPNVYFSVTPHNQGCRMMGILYRPPYKMFYPILLGTCRFAQKGKISST